jgi:hypothetical protein
MFVMLGDEADAEQGRGQRFFVYGAIQADNIKALNDGVEAARVAAKFNPTDTKRPSGK